MANQNKNTFGPEMYDPDSRTYDPANLFRVELPAGVVTDLTPIMESSVSWVVGQYLWALMDMSTYGSAYANYHWWPGVKDVTCPDASEYQRFVGPYTVVSVDKINKRVYWSRAIADWTPAEIEAEIAPKRPVAIFNSNRDADAFYNTFIGHRSWEQSVLETAKAFAAAGYTGDTPPAVAAMLVEYADTEMTAQEAADAIISKFADQAGVMGEMFAKRDKCQTAMHAAMVNDALEAAVAEWQVFFTGLCVRQRITPRYDYQLPQFPQQW